MELTRETESILSRCVSRRHRQRESIQTRECGHRTAEANSDPAEQVLVSLAVVGVKKTVSLAVDGKQAPIHQLLIPSIPFLSHLR